MISFLLAYVVASFRVRRIVGSSSVDAISKQLANLDLRSLGKPLRIGRFGSAFNMATRNVSRDREFNKTLLSIGVCICLSMVVLSGALVSADTSTSYVVRAMPPHVLIVANSNIYNQYVSFATSFSRLACSFGFTAGSQDPNLKSNLEFLNGIWSHIFLIPILALGLTCSILL